MTSTLNTVESAGKSLEQTIFDAISEARQTCEINGNNSAGCAVAWDIVEELQAEKAHQKQTQQHKTTLENYCETHPGSVECLMYDV
jgi:hypothetical protein